MVALWKAAGRNSHRKSKIRAISRSSRNTVWKLPKNKLRSSTHMDVPRSNKVLTQEEAGLRELRSQESYMEKYGFHFPTENYAFRARPGIDAEIVAEISHI